MVERGIEKIGVDLRIDTKYYNKLDIEGFSHMMKDPSYCYKFYWLEAIVQLITQDVTETTFDTVINEMICNAWYSVIEFHIHLSGISFNGEVRDGLERAVIRLSKLSGLKSNANKIEIRNAIKKYDKELKDVKSQLTNMVPYRALAGFFDKVEGTVDWGSTRRLTEYIQRINRDVILLPYTLGESSKLKKEIHFQPYWVEMIKENAVSILGWIQYEKVKWLQNNNPEVPGLVYKLAPLDEKMRKLGHVRKLWDGILDLCCINDVFTDKTVDKAEYDVDHFIPWSFVMNDELWNLMPMDSSLNSVKRNKLPCWDVFFIRFAENQYVMYEMIHQKEQIRKLYEACHRDNLHSIWANQELYRIGNTRHEFCNILEKNMKPVYDSARRQGYDVWDVKLDRVV